MAASGGPGSAHIPKALKDSDLPLRIVKNPHPAALIRDTSPARGMRGCNLTSSLHAGATP
jgi:hypothetical protein